MANSDTLHIFARHREDIVSYAETIVNDKHRAEDIAQDAYLRFEAAQAPGRPTGSIGYLLRIVRNLAIDYRRRKALENTLFMQDGADLMNTLPEAGPSTERQAVIDDELNQLRLALNDLPERTRIAMEMHSFGGYKLREIADHLDISISMAQVLVKEGVKHCQKHLARSDV
ncbi:MAG TPA: RNA polymerase subunit sigma-24 [Gammaproteobacteria bacterium]|nr:RNA polymerase subunit sigma-24 [Gammaproteobacteria bacterium]